MTFNLFKRLLPNGRAWAVIAEKRLRQFFEGLAAGASDPVVKAFDDVFDEINPQLTQQLAMWEDQFALVSAGLTEQERRDRLQAAWSAVGGQSPRYIQDTLRAAGFDVFVHDWWEPGTEPAIGSHACATPRNPLLVLRQSNTTADPLVECGEPLAACGEAFAECGNGLELIGYPLVNVVTSTSPDVIPSCGEGVAECGEPSALCGNFTEFIETRRRYTVPADPAKWPYFIYIGGEVYGDIAQVSPNRQNEFEALILKIIPRQLWVGVLVEYT